MQLKSVKKAGKWTRVLLLFRKRGIVYSQSVKVLHCVPFQQINESITCPHNGSFNFLHKIRPFLLWLYNTWFYLCLFWCNWTLCVLLPDATSLNTGFPWILTRTAIRIGEGVGKKGLRRVESAYLGGTLSPSFGIWLILINFKDVVSF